MVTVQSVLFTLFAVLATHIGIKFARALTFLYALSRKVQKPEEVDIKERFSREKVPEHIDYLILGGGVSGLASAVALSKAGHKVLVLEQHGKAGGCLHTFKKNGFEFDSGFHYIGASYSVRKLIDTVCSKPVEFNHFMHYDTILLDDEKIAWTAPHSVWLGAMKKRFPESAHALDAYESKAKRALIILGVHNFSRIVLPRALARAVYAFLRFVFADVYGRSTTDVLESIGIKNGSRVYAVLNAICLDFGAVPQNIPFAMHIGLMRHYSEGGSIYPKKGVREIVKSMVGAINACGGRVLTKAFVEKILVDGEGASARVRGVQLRGGPEVLCARVISTIGSAGTLKALAPQYQWPSARYSDEDAFTCFTLFVGFEGKDLRLPCHNVWDIDALKRTGYDLVALRKSFLDESRSDNLSMFISFPAQKMAGEGVALDQQTLIAITEARTADVLPYRINQSRRNEGYEEYKAAREKLMLDRLYELFPALKGAEVKYKSFGTPLTNEKYLGRFSAYGRSVTTDMMQQDFFLNFDTPVRGLYLSGEDTLHPSVVGALGTGLLSAARAGGYY